MMSLRAFLALLLIYIVYLIIGGFTFKATEQVIIIHSLCFASIEIETYRQRQTMTFTE